jgi:hypothetical protein
MKTSRFMFVPVAGIGWWALGYPPGWDWLIFPLIPSMGVSVGVLVTFGTVLVGIYAALIWLRNNVVF